MRIAVDARELAGTPTGVGRYLQELLAQWAVLAEAADCTVTLCAPTRLDAALPRAAGGARFDTRALPGLRGTLWEQVTLPAALAGQADCLFCPAYAGPWWSPVPSVVAIHDVSFHAHPEWFRWREGARRRWTTRLSARRAARVVTISDFSKSEIARWLGVAADRILVTPLGASPQVAALPVPAAPTPPTGPLVLYVGTYLNRRHLPTLVRAFAPIARRDRTARLVLVGQNRTFPPEDPMAVAQASGIAAQVCCQDWVTDAELGRLYADATVFAFLSVYEGFGLTPLEAMAAGVPVVAYDTPVAREIYGDAALLVAPGDTAAVTAALEGLVADGAERRRLVAAGPARAAGFSWARAAALTLQALRDAAA
jgi:glycosyltransferase involved in cell wall biosynthesis